MKKSLRQHHPFAPARWLSRHPSSAEEGSSRVHSFIAALLLMGLMLVPMIGQQRPTSQHAILAEYCLTCHSDKAKTGGLTLEGLDIDHPEANAEMWEKVIRKLRSGMMPPTGAPRPDRATYATFRRTLEDSLDRAAKAKPNPGATALHRMNRAEYANAIRDLLAIDVDPGTILPPDDSLEGLDNLSDVLGTSPALIERYIGAAAKISRLAVGDTNISPLSITYKVRGDVSQNNHIEGLPLGTRGGVVFKHNFPVDGEYLFKFSLLKVNFGPQYGATAKNEQLEMSLNGVRVLLLDLRSAPYYYIRGGAAGGPAPALEIRMPVKAGPQTIQVDFIKRTAADVDDLLQPFDATTADLQTGVQYGYTTVPHLSSVEILGPYAIGGPGDTPSRAKIFVCRPPSQRDEATCARRIVASLARRAYRRPIRDDDIAPLMAFYQKGREAGDFDTGVEMALRRILADPLFVFRFERDPDSLPVGGTHRVTDIELASRLSFFLWSSIPDDELLTVAEQNKLRDPAVLQQQVRRMLKDPKSQALISNFSGQWLFLRELRNRQPDLLLFPDFDDNLRQSFQRETEMLFASIVREDRNVLDVLTSDYTFVNERLAKHYGIPNIYGTDFRRVNVPSSARKGLFGQGSFLMLTSAANRTSPVTRGAWILENLLGSPPPAPPPDVPPFPEATNGQGIKKVVTSVRERMEQHRTNQPCKGCHQIMDPIGLSLENFDGIGRWRTEDTGSKIDTAGQLVDGTAIAGVDSLRTALLNYQDALIQTMTEKLMMYATGRATHYYDMPAVRAVARDAAGKDYRFSALVMAIVNSEPFQMRVKKAEEAH
jgi:hypothetical protein